MARRGSSMGLFGLFGRSEDLRQLDVAFRGAGLHPALVPEGAKLAISNLLKDDNGGRYADAATYPHVADLVAYCLLGHEAFEGEVGPDRAREVEDRIDAALEAGEGVDADLILLTLHSKLIQPSVVDRFGLSAEQGGE
jgi:hypothetical protein